MKKLDPNELALWIRLVLDLTGISLDETKEYLILERLRDLLEKYRCASFGHLYFLAREERQTALREDLIDRITTQETSFFRNAAPFAALRETILPELLGRCRKDGGKRPLTIWCAACATGQEVYSLAILLHELGAKPQEYRITGTDISRRALEGARIGRYNRVEMDRGITPPQRTRFFEPHREQWQVRDFLKTSLDFVQLALHQPFHLGDQFDLVLCRNVAIYFPETTRGHLFHRIAHHLRPEGYLLLGTTESIPSMGNLFQSTQVGKAVAFLLNPGAR
ncbi:MAG: protein-glutamate O-methyltransferase CheR [Candidatus Riflebacteria bacterium]|nr:protein-glutamate O-methyltransferase CheR [Candidatus Riflebacteria bacterium]